MNKIILTISSILLIISNLNAQNPVLEIWEIQGEGLFTPHLNEIVQTNQNVVTAVGDDYFFIQTPTYRSDNNQATSDGMYIETNFTPQVEVGNMVSISGTVREKFQRTQMDEDDGMTITIDSMQVAIPLPVMLTENFPSPDNTAIPDLEKVEGMLVSVSQATTNSPTNQFGETSVKIGQTRAFREAGIVSPAPSGLPEFDNNPEVFEIKLADGIQGQDHDWAMKNVSATGVMDYAFDDYILRMSEFEISGDPPLIAVDEPTNTEATIGCANIRGLSNFNSK